MSGTPRGLTVVVDGHRRRAPSLVTLIVGVEITYHDSTKDVEFFDDVEEMFGNHVVEWLDKHHPKMITVEITLRWIVTGNVSLT